MNKNLLPERLQHGFDGPKPAALTALAAPPGVTICSVPITPEVTGKLRITGGGGTINTAALIQFASLNVFVDGALVPAASTVNVTHDATGTDDTRQISIVCDVTVAPEVPHTIDLRGFGAATMMAEPNTWWLDVQETIN